MSVFPGDCVEDRRRNVFKRSVSLPLIGMSILLIAILTTGHAPVVTAQNNTAPTQATCNQIVPSALKSVAANCTDIGHNQVCYANNTLNVAYLNSDSSAVVPATAVATSAATQAAGPLAQVGDIAPLNMIKSIATAPLNLQTGEWGIAVLKLHTKVAGSAAWQAVTFILYGDTRLRDLAVAAPDMPTPTPYACTAVTKRAIYLLSQPDPNSQRVTLLAPDSTINLTGRNTYNSWAMANFQGMSGWVPVVNNITPSCDVSTLMTAGPDSPALLEGSDAFYFSTGIGVQTECNEVPTAGLLIQSPNGTKVTFRANGADITIASTVLLTADPNHVMTLYVLEGQAWMRAAGQAQTARTGQQLTVPLGNDANAGITDGLQVSSPPSLPQTIRMSNPNTIPTTCQIAVAAGLRNPCASGAITNNTTGNNNLPRSVSIPTQTPAIMSGPPPTATASVAVACQLQRFTASPNPAVTNGKKLFCSTLTWDVEGVTSVFLNGAGVVGHGSEQVCIPNTTTYTLTLFCASGGTQSAGVTVNVP